MAKITIPVSTIYQLVLRMESHYADRIAIRYYDEALEGVREIPYRQYAHDIRCQAAALQAAVPDIEGKRVCVLAANSYDYAVSIFATILTGAVLVPLNLQRAGRTSAMSWTWWKPAPSSMTAAILSGSPRSAGRMGTRCCPSTATRNIPPLRSTSAKTGKP